MITYLDNAATTRVCDEAAQAALQIMTERYGNPSSTHKMGRDAKHELDAARAKLSNALGAKPEELFSPPAARKATTGPSSPAHS